MATYGAPVVSDPIKSKIDGVDYYTKTSTKVTQGSDGKVNGGETTILYAPIAGVPIFGTTNYIPAATTKDGGKTWNYIKYKQGDDIPSGKKVGDEIFGNQAKKSLEGGALKTNTNKQIALTATKASIPPEQQKPLTLNQNTANPTGAEAGTSPAPVPVDLQKEITSSGATRKNYPDLRYPIDLANTKQDVIKFTMLEYQPKKFSELKDKADLGGFSGRDKERQGIGSVVLPISSGISDTNACDWGSDSMNAAEAFAANVALTGITKGIGEAAEKAGKIIEGTAKSPDVKTGFAGLFAGLAIGGSSRQILQRTEGAVLNPNMELLFNGPTLRPFSFTFKMSARSKEEAKEIIGIIRFFKQGMSPQKSASNLFLKSPNTFRIQYLHLGTDHPYIGKIKECALQSVTVSYTPEGQYATYVDGYMVSYEMQMQFTELEPIFNDDYGQGSGSSGPDKEIGF